MTARRLFIQPLERRLLLAGDTCPATMDVADVNQDGHVTESDAALVFDLLQRHVDDDRSRSTEADHELDVSRDGQVTALDALRIINRINQPGDLAVGESLNPDISIGDAQVIERHAGPNSLSFPITLSDTPASDITVGVSVTDDTARALQVDRVASGLSRPIFATAAPGQPDWLYIVEQRGHIEILDLSTGTVHSTRFLNVSNLATGNEQGLLGLAFHPDYQNNRLFYVYTTVSGGDTVIAEYQANVGGATANPSSARTIMTFDQPFSNHNGGWIGFGPDDYLYISSGDGGSGYDPQNNGQDITNNLLGKMLRIDVDGDDFPLDANRNYAIPPTNPFVDVVGDDEIWSYGLRNPWRSSFDRETGDLYIADVGQGVREEINVQPSASSGGENYGWRLREGTIQTPTSVGGPKPAGAIDPIYDYLHASIPTGGYSVSGGYVYRGPIPELQGHYFFADYVNPRVWSLRFNGDSPATFDGTNYTDFIDWTDLLDPDVGQINSISSFGEDAAGNLYILDLGGEVFRITAGADYLVPPTTFTIPAGGQSTALVVDVLGDRLAEANETFTVTLSNPSLGNLVDGQATGTIINDDAPKVQSVVVNGGQEQRSIVDEIVVTFDSIVTLDESQGSALELLNLGEASSVNLTKEVSNASGQTVVTIHFADGPSVELRGQLLPSLANGDYQLTILASRVALEGVSLDGDSDGAAGGNHVFVDDLFRNYGDNNGNQVVDLFDFSDFRSTFNKSDGDSGFLAPFDKNGDETINLFDFSAFRDGFGN